VYTKTIRFDALPLWREYHRAIGSRVVATNGCFDVIHRGHVDYLQRARELGDVLIVGLNSDESANNLKKFYPVNSQEDRAFVLAGLQAVTFVVVFDEVTARSFLEAAQPTVWAKGGDYTEATLDQEELAIVKKHGGQVAIMPLVSGYSTGRTLRKMEKANAANTLTYAEEAQAAEVLPGDVSRRDEAPATGAGDSKLEDPGEDAGSVLRAPESLRAECSVPKGAGIPRTPDRT
jgi:rfaE bifunctional protein nucleotidyltransferase chain/domain